MVSATLCAALLLIGVLAAILARRHGVSGTPFAIGPAIPPVSGSHACKAVMGIVVVVESPHPERGAELLLAVFDNGIKATLTVRSSRLGIARPGLAWSAFRRKG